MNSTNSKKPQKPIDIGQTPARQEFDHLLEKVREMTYNKPEKAVLIISDWLKKSLSKKVA